MVNELEAPGYINLSSSFLYSVFLKIARAIMDDSLDPPSGSESPFQAVRVFYFR